MIGVKLFLRNQWTDRYYCDPCNVCVRVYGVLGRHLPSYFPCQDKGERNQYRRSTFATICALLVIFVSRVHLSVVLLFANSLPCSSWPRDVMHFIICQFFSFLRACTFSLYYCYFFRLFLCFFTLANLLI